MRFVFLGLSITSSWGNGHATNYRALTRALARRGHEVRFLERDKPWYAAHRDLESLPGVAVVLYDSLEELERRYGPAIVAADAVVVGSYVPEGADVLRAVLSLAHGVTAFYDIDTPVTLEALERGECEYLVPELVPQVDHYLSFTGGPTLERLRREFGAVRPGAFYCLVDPAAYPPLDVPFRWDLGYLGTYSPDRQEALDELLLEPARRRPDRAFAVAGSMYPEGVDWPPNVRMVGHLPPAGHAAFYARQRLTLSVTRAEMRAAGWSPSVRLFEAAACGVPVVSDRFEGLDEFFVPGKEILVAERAADVLAALDAVDPEARARIGAAARARVLAANTADHRAAQLESTLFGTDAVAAESA